MSGVLRDVTVLDLTRQFCAALSAAFLGDFGARVRVGRDPVRAAPVVVDGILIVQTAGGDLGAYRLQ